MTLLPWRKLEKKNITELSFLLGLVIRLILVTLGFVAKYCWNWAKLPMHGKTSQIKHNSQGVFTNLPQKLEVMRYHSLVVNPHTLPSCLEITAITSHNADLLEDLDLPTLLSQHLDSIEIMGLRHKHYPIEGVQFHPESFATEGGAMMLQNFLFRPT